MDSDYKPQVHHSEHDEVDHLLCEAGLVLLLPLFNFGFFPTFEDGSKVKLIKAEN